jgi:hypothetical protein
MTFARTWIKVPFMRFDRSIVDKAGTASTRTLAPGLEGAAWYGSPMFKETSTLENASGGPATPNDSSTDVDPPRSQPTLASDWATDGPAAMPLMPSLSPLTLKPTARQPGRTVPTRLTARAPLSRGSESLLVKALLQFGSRSPSC